MKTLPAIAALLLSAVCLHAQKTVLEPSGTYMFAQRDTCSLFLDVYDPAEGSATSIDGVAKPTIMFVFGGGFVSGNRSKPTYLSWFRRLTENGFRVVSIDYRLGMKNATEKGLAWVKRQENAINIAVEDLFSATKYLIDNAEALGINPNEIVISGSSAGAITVLQGDWILCNGKEMAKVLPDGFRYAGVMSFSGAVFSSEGAIKYKREPDPTLFLHGTDDAVVKYSFIHLLKYRFDGSDALSSNFAKNGYNYNIIRFKGNSHEIAGSMNDAFSEEMRFIETNVMKKQKRVVDSMIEDPSIDNSYWKKQNLKTLYN